jgi:hypothetical protein
MNTPQKKLIGQILLEEGFITTHQLEHALKIQESVRKKQLGQILVDLSYITKSQLNRAIAIQGKMEKTGETEVLHHV